MAYRLKAAEPVAAGVRRAVGEEIDRAIAILSRAGRARRADAVHECRKHLKKARAILKLARFGLGDLLYRRENQWLRDAGRGLSEARDAEVLVETLSKLRRHLRLGRRQYSSLRTALGARKREIERRALDQHRAIPKAIEALRAARTRVDDWQIRSDGWDVLGPGLRKTYRDGRRAFGQAARDPTFERIHEWRKRAKDLWHELQFLTPVWPAAMDATVDEVHRLGDRLGDDHDLAVLRATVEDLGAIDAEELVRAIDHRRAALEAEARLIAARLWVETPTALVDRIEGYWRAWRSEP